jgi:CRP/FNR family cyclic AMP-dependent transcriptional regulator
VAVDQGADQAGLFVQRVFTCPPEVAREMVRRGRLRRYPLHAAIVRQGDRTTLGWLVLVGRAHALLYSADGQMVLLQEYRVGDLFGALAELGAALEEADVVAVEPVDALTLEGAELAMLAQRHGCIGLALTRMLLRRLRQTTSRMYERAALTSAGRVYAELLRQARESPDLVLRPAPVIAELALRVATTRETASRAVNALERRGLIRREPHELRVVAPHRLEALIL